jgi:hypothetical protein
MVNKRPLTELCALLVTCFQIANTYTRLHYDFKRALTAWGTGRFF